MFMVFSKEKIVSYLVSLSTVAILFLISFAITKKNNEIIRTSTNVIESNIVETNTKNQVVEEKDNVLNEN